MSAFSEWLTRFKNQQGWSQNRLAQELGVSSSQASYWLRGERHPTPRSVESIARRLGVSERDLLMTAGYDVDTPTSRLSREELATVISDLEALTAELREQRDATAPASDEFINFWLANSHLIPADVKEELIEQARRHIERDEPN